MAIRGLKDGQVSGSLNIEENTKLQTATVSADGMAKDPQTDNEAGFLTIEIADGTTYQIPFYASS